MGINLLLYSIHCSGSRKNCKSVFTRYVSYFSTRNIFHYTDRTNYNVYFLNEVSEGSEQIFSSNYATSSTEKNCFWATFFFNIFDTFKFNYIIWFYKLRKKELTDDGKPRILYTAIVKFAGKIYLCKERGCMKICQKKTYLKNEVFRKNQSG